MNSNSEKSHLGICLLIGISTLLFPSGSVIGQGPPIDAQGRIMHKEDDQRGWVIQEKAAAIASALKIFGLDAREANILEAELLLITQDNTPFLNELVIGRRLWRVVVEVEVADAAQEPQKKTFDIILDPNNASLIRISSRIPPGLTARSKEASASSAVDQMSNRGSERYHAFVPGVPAISFQDALTALDKNGINTSSAQQLIGHYVIWSRMGKSPKPIWALTLNGIPTFEASYPGVAEEARNHMRYIVDPETRMWICATTTPQPAANSENSTPTETAPNEK